MTTNQTPEDQEMENYLARVENKLDRIKDYQIGLLNRIGQIQEGCGTIIFKAALYTTVTYLALKGCVFNRLESKLDAINSSLNNQPIYEQPYQSPQSQSQTGQEPNDTQ